MPAAPKRLPRSFAILLIAILAILSAAAVFYSFRSDTFVREQILAAQGKRWKKTAEYQRLGAISKYGDWPQLMAVGGIGLLIAWRLRSREWKRILIAAMVASTLAGALANVSRLTTGRTRPRESPKIVQGWYGPFHEGKLTVGNSKYNAFPSGHTATAVGFAGVLLFARPLLGLLAMAAALVVAWSRMALGAHHLSDVTVASILALLVAWLVWRLAVTRGDEISQFLLQVQQKLGGHIRQRRKHP